MKIAYIVYIDKDPDAYPYPEHDLLLQYLQDKGLDIQHEEWADESVDWTKYSCIVHKCPWDYVAKTQLFYNWLEKIKALGIPMHNPADILKWNSDKHYLQDIANAGLKVIPTIFLESGTKFRAAEYLKQFNSTGIIVKPCISGTSRNTFKITNENTADETLINQLLQQEAMMVQPFMPQVIEEGEWSLLFFNGRFSHALLKTPVNGDFRSQANFGARIQPRMPEPGVLESAGRYVSTFANGCLYARVDGLIIENEFYLMELELIDPVLFLSTHAEGYEKYYIALRELI